MQGTAEEAAGWETSEQVVWGTEKVVAGKDVVTLGAFGGRSSKKVYQVIKVYCGNSLPWSSTMSMLLPSTLVTVYGPKKSGSNLPPFLCWLLLFCLRTLSQAAWQQPLLDPVSTFFFFFCTCAIFSWTIWYNLSLCLIHSEMHSSGIFSSTLSLIYSKEENCAYTLKKNTVIEKNSNV